MKDEQGKKKIPLAEARNIRGAKNNGFKFSRLKPSQQKIPNNEITKNTFIFKLDRKTNSSPR